MRIWMDGSLVDRADAKVSVFDHGVLYGDGVFEGIRAYGGRIFKMRSHLERLKSSAGKIRLELPYSLDELERAMRETLEANGLSDGYIRLVVTRGVGTDLRTRPVSLTAAAAELAAAIGDPWAEFVEGLLGRLDEAERAELYRLLLKGSSPWDDVWETEGEVG